jgi:hypothetical protein
VSKTSYNLVTAGVAVGLNRSSILKAIKTGKISATRDELGGWCIEPAELHRVYPPVASTTPDNQPIVTWGSWGNMGNTKNRDAEIAELRARLTDARDEIEFLRRTHTELTAERTRLTALLIADQRPRRPWWRRWSQ